MKKHIQIILLNIFILFNFNAASASKADKLFIETAQQALEKHLKNNPIEDNALQQRVKTDFPQNPPVPNYDSNQYRYYTYYLNVQSRLSEQKSHLTLIHELAFIEYSAMQAYCAHKDRELFSLIIMIGGSIYDFYNQLLDARLIDEQPAIEAFNKAIKEHNDYVMGYTDENSQSAANTFNNES